LEVNLRRRENKGWKGSGRDMVRKGGGGTDKYRSFPGFLDPDPPIAILDC